jgi:hypothetical protein
MLGVARQHWGDVLGLQARKIPRVLGNFLKKIGLFLGDGECWENIGAVLRRC